MTIESAEKTNRLITENSPYLLQHAHNPVDWYAWNEEAFEKAKKENKPVFLSIGYSSCHWCHVMEKESFSDEHIAQILNEHFISIKVDREERQDIDDVYMNAVQAMTGTGGWPLSVFLTPDGMPFYGGTYFPPKDYPGRPSFERILITIADAWKKNRVKLVDSAEKISIALSGLTAEIKTVSLSDEILIQANSQIKKAYDEVNGGFGAAPKFPQPGCILLLLNYWHRTDDNKSLEMAETTLQKMADGGIYDQLGGGFHRYATDSEWRVPHFEKMLYDQALISKIYVQAFQASGKEFYAQIARDILEYVLNEMTDKNGGFHSTQDADTQGKEGEFYIWEMEEIENILGRQNAEIFNKHYGVTNKGNFEERKNILHINKTIEQVAERFNEPRDKIKNFLSESRKKLLEHRLKRTFPEKDDKIITGWNGLMISSFAFSGAVLNEPKYIEAAQKCANFILDALYKNKRLMRYYRNDKASNLGVLDDYAFLACGLIDLYEAVFNPKWLIKAKEITDQMIELFENHKGGFYLAAKDTEQLFIQNIPSYDSPIPSGNSAAVMAMLKLDSITGKKTYASHIKDLFNAFSAQMVQMPLLMTYILSAFDFYSGPCKEIVIASESANDENAKKMLRKIRETFLPNSVLVFHSPSQTNELKKIAPFVTNQLAINGKATAYVCSNKTCGKPATTIKELEMKIKKLV
ncbi:MAG: Glycosyl hydrolase family 76 [Planctomycetes bacterium ADurb.Bin401]|nr:MAG: Glycosyl hydrolase family 76 [Planctomycetes bacterium ADurb.Bin401]